MSKKISKEVQAPKKKKHKGLKIFLIILCIIIVLPIAFVFIAFFDTGTKNVSKSEVHYENIVAEGFYKGLQGLTEEEPKISFTVNEEMIDGIMMAACEKINQEQYIPKMYCFIDDNNYTFTMEAKLSFFKTRVFIITSLEQDDDNILNFKIDKIKIGRLPIPFSWVSGLLTKFINDDTLNNAFSNSGFHIQSNLSEGKLTYSRMQFRLDIGDYLIKSGKNNPYLDLLLNMIGDKEHRILTTDYKDGVTASFDLSQLELKESEYYVEPPLSFQDLDDHANKIVEWLNSGDLKEENVDEMFTYLVRGYAKSSSGEGSVQEYIYGLEDSFKEKVKGYINSTSNEFEELTDYTGSYVSVNGAEATRFEEYCGTDSDITASFTLEPETLPTSAVLSIGSDSVNKYLAGTMTDGIGKTIPITFKDENNKWGFSYIVVDNLFVNFKEGEENNPKMVMYLTLNINGVQVSLILANNNINVVNTSDLESNPRIGDLTFDLKEKYFGAIPVTDTSLLNKVLDLLPTSGETFLYNSDIGLGQFTINLDNVSYGDTPLDKKTVAEIILAALGAGGKCTKTASEDGKTFQLTFAKQST